MGSRILLWGCLALVALAGGCSGKGLAQPAAGPASPAGKCAWVTADVVARAAGLAVVKPVETLGGCTYMYNPGDAMPSIDPAAAEIPAIPPGVDFAFHQDSVAIDAVQRDLSSTGATLVRDVGVSAGWFEDPAEDYYELCALVPGGVVRISITPLSERERSSSDGLKEIAVKVFKAAEPRLPR